jgi:hypothetical protein
MHLIRLRNLAAAAVAMTAQPTIAQDPSRYDLLHSSYALWGMMDGMANFCWELSGYDVAYMEGHQSWLARNVFVRDELDQTLSALGEDPGVAAAGETAGRDGILEILNQAVNKEESCLTWLAAAQGETQFEAEQFLSYQLGILRERDGL